MKAIQAKSKEVNELRDVINEWASAVEMRDIDGILKHYVDNVRVFDVPEPEELRGKEAYRRNWETFLGRIEGEVKCDFREMEVFANDELGFVHTLTSIHAAQLNPDHCPWVRVTVCFQKIAGKWIAVHEHVSVPAAMSPTANEPQK
jgi:ketosteroid isomerase-like protein